MGRRADPPTLQLVKGNQKRGADRTPRAADLEITPPPMTVAALEVWQRLAPDLATKRVLDHWNADLFAEYCEAAATARAARAEIDELGILVVGQKGERVKNPAHQVWRDATAVMTVIAAKFGLSPVDRRYLRPDPAIDAGGPAVGPLDPQRLLS